MVETRLSLNYVQTRRQNCLLNLHAHMRLPHCCKTHGIIHVPNDERKGEDVRTYFTVTVSKILATGTENGTTVHDCGVVCLSIRIGESVVRDVSVGKSCILLLHVVGWTAERRKGQPVDAVRFSEFHCSKGYHCHALYRIFSVCQDYAPV